MSDLLVLGEKVFLRERFSDLQAPFNTKNQTSDHMFKYLNTSQFHKIKTQSTSSTCFVLQIFPPILPGYKLYLNRPPPPLLSREVPPGSWFNNGTSVRRAPRGAKPTEPLQGKRPATRCKGEDGWNSSGWWFFSTPSEKYARQIGIIFSKNG